MHWKLQWLCWSTEWVQFSKSWTNWSAKFCLTHHIHLISGQPTTTSSSISTTFFCKQNAPTTSKRQKMLSKSWSNPEAQIFMLHNLLRQPHPPEGRQKKQEELQSCSLQNKNNNHKKLNKTKRQRITSQMKEQDKTPEKQLNDMEISNLPEKEFRIITVKIIQDLWKRMERMQEMFTKDLEELN